MFLSKIQALAVVLEPLNKIKIPLVHLRNLGFTEALTMTGFYSAQMWMPIKFLPVFRKPENVLAPRMEIMHNLGEPCPT